MSIVMTLSFHLLSPFLFEFADNIASMVVRNAYLDPYHFLRFTSLQNNSLPIYFNRKVETGIHSAALASPLTHQRSTQLHFGINVLHMPFSVYMRNDTIPELLSCCERHKALSREARKKNKSRFQQKILYESAYYVYYSLP